MKLINGDQSVIEGRHAKPLHRKTKRGVGAYQHPIIAFQERAHGIHLAAVVRAWRIAQVPARLDPPIGPKTKFTERLVVKARANGFFGHHDQRLPNPLMV